MTRDLTHERCAHRCCCDSWSCEPHRGTCSTVERPHFAAGGIVPAGAKITLPAHTQIWPRPSA